MTTSLSTKFAALALALAMNSVLMGSVALLFTTGSAQAAAVLVDAQLNTAPSASA